uniref:(P)ppGpp synthetase/hydrolase n=1 Tax=Clandestinovirus TaxID=2831644 RepID=A0A8F8KL62_9VIRU|nr:(p)ppGpp synthetase/hydrolase [Clandestinovirus]
MSAKLLEAIRFAVVKHKGQTRKNKTNDPYIVHPIEACQILMEANVQDDDVLMAAVLHDVLEDTATTIDEIQSKFGTRVARIVRECTDDKSVSKIDRKKLQIEHVREASNEAKLVKLADKLSNLRGLLSEPPTAWAPEEIKGYALWCMVVCEAAGSIPNILLNLERRLQEVFEQFGLTSLNADEKALLLENYYRNIVNSD